MKPRKKPRKKTKEDSGAIVHPSDSYEYATPDGSGGKLPIRKVI